MAVNATGTAWLRQLVNAILPSPQNSDPTKINDESQLQTLYFSLAAILLGFPLRGRKPIGLSGGSSRGLRLLGRNPIRLGRSSVVKPKPERIAPLEGAETPEGKPRFKGKDRHPGRAPVWRR